MSTKDLISGAFHDKLIFWFPFVDLINFGFRFMLGSTLVGVGVGVGEGDKRTVTIFDVVIWYWPMLFINFVPISKE